MIKYNNYKKEGVNDSMYRPSGGDLGVGTGVATIANIKGNTVAWNQIQPAISSLTKREEGVTFSLLGSGRKIVAQVASGGVTGNSYAYGGLINLLPGHKYYAHGCPKGGSLTTFFLINARYGYGFDTGNGYIFTCDSTHTQYSADFVLQAGVPEGVYTALPQITDLTLIYGEDNEPTTVEQFEADYEKWFGKPLTYGAYDTGSLRSVQLDALKTTGFNLWDEEWEAGAYDDNGNKIQNIYTVRSKNAISVIPNTDHYVDNSKIDRIMAYTNSGECIGRINNPQPIVRFPTNCAFIRFNTNVAYGSTYNHDICINISDTSKNGTYEPYEEHVAPLHVTTLKGKLNGEGESVTIFPNGMRSAGDVADEIYTVGDKTYAVVRVGGVEMGSLTWTKNGAYAQTAKSTIGMASVATMTNSAGLILIQFGVATTLMSISQNESFFNVNVDGDGANMATKLSGKYLYYKLAEPLVYEVEGFTLPKTYLVNANGTEEQIQVSDVQGLAAPINTIYNNDVAKMIKNNTEIKKVYKGTTLIWEKPQ